jgi:putative flippase GtrA
VSADPPADAKSRWRAFATSARPGGRAHRLGRFGIVGLTGIAVNEVALAVLVGGLHLRYIVGYLLATQFSTLWNFGWIEMWAFKSVAPTNRKAQRFASLLLVNNVANLLTAPLFLLLTVGAGINYLVSNMLTLALIFLLRFLFAERIWSPRQAPGAPTWPGRRRDHRSVRLTTRAPSRPARSAGSDERDGMPLTRA